MPTDDTKAETVAVQASRVMDEAQFLIDRLREFEGLVLDGEVAREYFGHVAPSVARLKAALAAPQTSEDDVWRPIVEAKKDGTMYLLLVDYNDEDAFGELEQFPDNIGRTIGCNCGDNDGIDEWKLAGWDWCNDCFTDCSTEGSGAKVIAFAELPSIAALSPRPQAGTALEIGETVLTAICARKGIDVAGYEVGKVVSVEGPRAVVHVGGEDLWFSLGEIFRSAARQQQVAAPRPQAGMISADRACEIVGAILRDEANLRELILEDSNDHPTLVFVKPIEEAISTIRKEAGDGT